MSGIISFISENWLILSLGGGALYVISTIITNKLNKKKQEQIKAKLKEGADDVSENVTVEF